MPPAIRPTATWRSSSCAHVLWTAPFISMLTSLAAATSVRAQEVFTPPIWNGIYAGVHGGVNQLGFDADGYGSEDLSAGTFGLHIGLAKQLGPWIVGAEADIDLTSAKETVDFSVTFPPFAVAGTAKTELSATGSIRGRLGYAILPNAMIYATAGYAWASVDASFAGTINGAAVSASSGTTLDGIAYGAGVEAFVLPQLLLRVEYLHTDYADQSFTSSVAGIGTLNTSLDSDVVRAGITWRFN